tara:strand:+ start:634 stop:1041 length:408 start_codon:yes stop_codon:yes gene_type:complete
MKNKFKKILSEISPGELLDKISILEIKMEKVKDKNSQDEIKKEYKILNEIQNSTIDLKDEIKNLFDSLKTINTLLWDIEDKLRIYEKNQNFGKDFIELARGVYFNNDKRAKLKNEINTILNSSFKEIKQYVNYNI